jgi:hypothetical protein
MACHNSVTKWIHSGSKNEIFEGLDNFDSYSLQAEVYADPGCSKMLGYILPVGNSISLALCCEWS